MLPGPATFDSSDNSVKPLASSGSERLYSFAAPKRVRHEISCLPVRGHETWDRAQRLCGACVMKAKPFRLALVLVVQAIWLSGCETKQQAATGPPAVEFVEVSQKDVPVTKEWVATLDGFVNAQIRAQVKGLLVKQNYTNGAFISTDAALFEIDPRPFQAA